jgi:hypothetical protein
MVRCISLDILYGLKSTIVDRLELDSEFVKHYQKMILEDKNKPLFSQTQRFNSFPNPSVSSGKGEWSTTSSSSSSSTKSGGGGSKHRIIITRGPSGAGGEEQNDPRTGGRWSTAVTELDKARQIFLSIMNKISKSNLQELFQELMLHLQKYPYYEFYQQMHMDLYHKLLTDKTYHEYYIKIVALLCKFKKFYESFVRTEKREDGYYFTLRYFKKPEKDVWTGPYPSEKVLYENVFMKYNVRNGMIRICDKEFANRFQYVKDMAKETEEEKIVSLKRRIFAPIEIILSMYDQQLVMEKTLPLVLKDVYKPNEQGIHEEELIYLLDLFIRRKYLKDESYDEMRTQVSTWLSEKQWSKRCTFFMEELLKKIGALTNVSIVIPRAMDMDGLEKGALPKEEEEDGEYDWDEICEEGFESKDSASWAEWMAKWTPRIAKETEKTAWIALLKFGLDNVRSMKRLQECVKVLSVAWKLIREDVLADVEEQYLADWSIDVPSIRKTFDSFKEEH